MQQVVERDVEVAQVYSGQRDRRGLATEAGQVGQVDQRRAIGVVAEGGTKLNGVAVDLDG